MALAVVVALCGCGSEPTDTATPTNPAADEAFGTPEAAYTVRGIVRQLPEPPLRDLRIEHEPIPTFRGSDGNVYVNKDGVPGMKAMAMDFPLVVDGVDLSTISVGDVVEFTFELRWRPPTQGGAAYRVTKITRLDIAADALNFANPPAASEPADPAAVP